MANEHTAIDVWTKAACQDDVLAHISSVFQAKQLIGCSIAPLYLPATCNYDMQTVHDTWRHHSLPARLRCRVVARLSLMSQADNLNPPALADGCCTKCIISAHAMVVVQSASYQHTLDA
jgi:hypothetical protein